MSVETVIGRRRVAVTTGKTLRIRCTANGSPDPAISWYRNEELVGDSGRVRTLPDGTLVVDTFQSLDSGAYRCKATNNRGTDSETIMVDDTGTFVCFLI